MLRGALQLGERRDRGRGPAAPAGGRPPAAGSCRTGRSAGPSVIIVGSPHFRPSVDTSQASLAVFGPRRAAACLGAPRGSRHAAVMWCSANDCQLPASPRRGRAAAAGHRDRARSCRCDGRCRGCRRSRARPPRRSRTAPRSRPSVAAVVTPGIGLRARSDVRRRAGRSVSWSPAAHPPDQLGERGPGRRPAVRRRRDGRDSGRHGCARRVLGPGRARCRRPVPPPPARSPASRNTSRMRVTGHGLTTHGRARCRRSSQRPAAAVRQHARQQCLVVAAQVRAGGPGAQHAVPAGGIVDQVAQRLRHRRARAPAEQRGQLGAAAPGVERAAHARLGDPVHVRRRPSTPGRRRSVSSRASSGRRSGHDDGQVGLDEEVVDRLGQALVSARRGAAVRPVQDRRARSR